MYCKLILKSVNIAYMPFAFVPKYQELLMSSINDFSLKSLFFFVRITALENVLIVAFILQDYPMTV